MKDTLFYLMDEYKRLLDLKELQNEWLKEDGHSIWNYRGERASKAEIERVRIMIKDLMLKLSKEM